MKKEDIARKKLDETYINKDLFDKVKNYYDNIPTYRKLPTKRNYMYHEKQLQMLLTKEEYKEWRSAQSQLTK